MDRTSFYFFYVQYMEVINMYFIPLLVTCQNMKDIWNLFTRKFLTNFQGRNCKNTGTRKTAYFLALMLGTGIIGDDGEWKTKRRSLLTIISFCYVYCDKSGTELLGLSL